MHHLAQTSHLWLYFVLVAGIIVLPGMDMAFVLASALAGGRKAGLAAVSGIVTGGWVHMALGALGIGLLLRTAPGAFAALLVAGSAYVAWIGWSLFRGAGALGAPAHESSRPALATFGRAVATCLLNPKAYLFMLAVFPQFLRPGAGTLGAQVVVLAAITSATQAAVYGGLALAAAGSSTWLRGNPATQRRLGRGMGALLVLAAAWTLAQGLLHTR